MGTDRLSRVNGVSTSATSHQTEILLEVLQHFLRKTSSFSSYLGGQQKPTSSTARNASLVGRRRSGYISSMTVPVHCMKEYCTRLVIGIFLHPADSLASCLHEWSDSSPDLVSVIHLSFPLPSSTAFLFRHKPILTAV